MMLEKEILLCNIKKSTLRTAEEKKIDCGIEHFKAAGEDVRYIVATTFDDVLNKVNN